jgi:hypothetical protein
MKRTLESLSIIEEKGKKNNDEQAMRKLHEDLEVEGQGERGMDE